MLPPSSLANSQYFPTALLTWFDQHGRKNLPWQQPRSAYYVWLSEIMLQQTQVKTVIPYFLKFIDYFPTLADLAAATEDEVLSLWAGLGYYQRGRNLLKTARFIAAEFNGIIPDEVQKLKALPGIGESTAAAIVSLAFNRPAAILDGNVKRILSRYFLIAGDPNAARTKKTFFQHAEACLPRVDSQSHRAADYTQAIMDLGAMVCTPEKPNCPACPLQSHCLAYRHEMVSAYPQKPFKKKLSTREAQFILLHDPNDRQIYLEKQPTQGVWGGLWSLPTIDIDTCAITYLATQYGISISSTQTLPMLKHTFTHFKLHLYPIVVPCKPWLIDEVLRPRAQWLQVPNIGAVGIPKPIQRIIQQWITQ